MRYTLLILATALLLLIAGCSTEDARDSSAYYPVPDTSLGVTVLAPRPNDTLRAIYHWSEQTAYNQNCPWRYVLDTTLIATVVARVPGGIHSAQAVLFRSATGEPYSYGERIYPTSDTARVPLFQFNDSNPYNVQHETTDLWSAIWVTSGDGSNWLSASVPLTLSKDLELIEPVAPFKPDVSSLVERANSPYNSLDALDLTWCERSPGVDSFLVSLRISGAESVATMRQYNYDPGDQHDAYLTVYRPDTTYDVWVQAFNPFGVSPCSDTLTIRTGPPSPPIQLSTSLDGPDAVWFYWQNRRVADSVRIERRLTAADWTPLATLPYPTTYSDRHSYRDTTIVSGNEYAYRVGIVLATRTWWSADAATIAVP